MSSDRHAYQFFTTALTTVPCLPTHASLTLINATHASLALLHATYPTTALLQHPYTHFRPTKISLYTSHRARTSPNSTTISRLSTSLLTLRANRCFRPLHHEVVHVLGPAVCIGLPPFPALPSPARASLDMYERAMAEATKSGQNAANRIIRAQQTMSHSANIASTCLTWHNVAVL